MRTLHPAPAPSCAHHVRSLPGQAPRRLPPAVLVLIVLAALNGLALLVAAT
ncbi:MAG TPA: hypothetical protein VHK88_08670 [Aquihabitans sp.]|jgi:hypothetical protein|nr:hypothetical protein [Aquihabitans sp.]